MAKKLPEGFRLEPLTAEQVEAVVSLCETYYRAENYPFDRAHMTRAFQLLRDNEDLGRIWSVLAPDGEPVGYLAVTLGFSLEYGGRDAFLDEMYVAAEFRGKGLGRALIEQALDWCRNRDVRAIHLEVESINDIADSLYRKMGFGGNDRRLLTYRFPENSR